jgi:tRNA(His) guanylyltransferase
MTTSMGDRMKGYENSFRFTLPKRMPVLIRVDGKAFHTFTKGMERPFDEKLSRAMWETSKYLCENIGGCKLAYTQSDEISLLITNYDKLTTQSWFNNNLQKIASVAASMATAKFNEGIHKDYPDKPLALFDARAWVLPKEEVNSYFVWRQNDATKNSISMVAQSQFPHKELQGLKGYQLQDKLMFEKGINWNDLPTWQKRGATVEKETYSPFPLSDVTRTRWVIQPIPPVFSKNLDYVNDLVNPQVKEGSK